MAADVIADFPDHDKCFDVYKDSLDHQMGACIMQDSCPTAHYSKKLKSAQKIKQLQSCQQWSLLKNFGQCYLVQTSICLQSIKITFGDLKSQ